PTVEQRTALCERWFTRCDRDSRMTLLRYLIDTEFPATRELLAKLVIDGGDTHDGSEAWREIAEILTERRIAARYRTNVVLATIRRETKKNWSSQPRRFSERIEDFCVLSCDGSRDELQGLLRDCAKQLQGKTDRESAEAFRVLTSEEATVAWLGKADTNRQSQVARDRTGIGRVAPPDVQLILGVRIAGEVSDDVARSWQSLLAQELGIPVPQIAVTRKRDEEEDETRRDYFECGVELRIKGESVAIDNFFPQRRLVFKRHLERSGSVDLSNAEVDYNFGFQEDVCWLAEQVGAQRELQHRTLSTHDAIGLWLAIGLRTNVNKFFDFDQLIELLRDTADEVNVTHLFQNVSLPALRRIIVNLGEESVPITKRRVDLLEELQRLIVQGGNTDVISQKLREHVSRDLCFKLADDTGTLPILIFEEGLEA